MFNKTHIDLGVLSPYKEVKVIYPYDEDTKIILDINPSCGCSIAFNDQSNRQIVVHYTPVSIPQHLKSGGQKEYTVIKDIKVKFTNLADAELNVVLTLQSTVIS